MCSTISMPADYEMLVAHSPPIYLSHSPPITDFLSNFTNNCRVHSEPYYAGKMSPLARQTSVPKMSLVEHIATFGQCTAPTRSCLARQTKNLELETPRLKKKVVFADAKGFSLTQVRVMSEPSNVPPTLNIQFLSQVTKGISAEAIPEPWEIIFSQPASDYLDFRRKLDSGNVCLENVIIKESEQSIVGTIKVRNLSFHKEVFVRSSSDEWNTHEDAFCTYVNANTFTNSSTASYNLYDTFSFKLTLPPISRRVQFCVCFRCDDKEFWDNNNEKNYTVVKKYRTINVEEIPQLKVNESTKCDDALHAKLQSWSEFASWKDLANECPYW